MTHIEQEVSASERKTLSVLRHVIRGCRTLPYVGEHPGTGFVVMLILTGGAAGWKGGLVGILMGAALMAVVMLPMYLWGAYDRSVISERLSRKAPTPEAEIARLGGGA
jgi:hypothetical protein